MNPMETLGRMSPTMCNALANLDQGGKLHGREVSSLTTRGLARHVNGGLAVTGHGDEVLRLIKEKP